MQFTPIQPDQILVIKPVSQYYPGPYETRVLAVDGARAILHVPIHQGKVVLLGVGTQLEVFTAKGQPGFQSEIIHRNYQDTPTITIVLPDQEHRPEKTARVIAVTSGKGGVGKTSLVINSGIALAQQGLRVFIIDADLGTANVDVLLNIHTDYNLRHVLDQQKSILDIVVEGPGGIFLVPGSSGLQSLADMDTSQLQRVIENCKTLEAYADVILIDTGAGLSKSVINFVLAASQVVLVTTTEPHAITDGYALLKVTSEYPRRPPFGLVINRAETAAEAAQISERITAVARRYLEMEVDMLGFIPDDPTVVKAIKRQTPHLLAFPNSPAAQGIRAIAQRLCQPAEPPTGTRSFFDRVRELFTLSR